MKASQFTEEQFIGILRKAGARMKTAEYLPRTGDQRSGPTHRPSERSAPLQPRRIRARQKGIVTGHTGASKISTSYVERQNLTMRMRMRTLTTLTNELQITFPKT